MDKKSTDANLFRIQAEKLQHELLVHQIELEMQNEELQRINLALHIEHDRYVSLYDFAPVGYLTLTRDGRVTEINLTAAAMLGVNRQTLLNQYFSAFVVPKDSDSWHLFFTNAMKHNERRTIFLTLKNSNHTESHVQIDGQNILSLDENSTLRLSLTDIAERKQIEAQLQQLVNQEHCRRVEQSQFMTMLAHELKTPLSVIQLALGCLIDSPEILVHANQSINDIKHVIERCLQSEQVADEELKIHLSDCDLVVMLGRIRQRMPAPNRLVINTQSQLMLHTDEQLLYAVLFNLIDNALKYSPLESWVHIEVHTENKSVSLSIQNLVSIAGFPDATKVFQKYYRSKTAHHQTGSGLGLYLVKTMVNLLGGEADYYHDETSIIFKLSLPFSQASAA
jgi:PAS domain S-box-containing protein